MTQPDEPLFRVVKGSPTEEELAALVAVLTQRAGASAAEPPPRESAGWSAYWRSVRAPVQPGPEAWRLSGRPQ